jgi:hypothetical protein
MKYQHWVVWVEYESGSSYEEFILPVEMPVEDQLTIMTRWVEKDKKQVAGDIYFPQIRKFDRKGICILPPGLGEPIPASPEFFAALRTQVR